MAADKQDPSKPNYDEAKYYRGLGSPLDAVQPSLTTAVTKKLRDDAEIEKQRQKAAEAKKPGGSK